jgi:triosephosphate isomerase
VRDRVPPIVLNFKAYRESSGEGGLALVRVCEEVAEETGVGIAVCPQQVDLALTAEKTGVPVYAQHVESFEAGSKTGYVVLEAVKAAGAVGTLLNHSEHPMEIAAIEAVIRRAETLGLVTLACANNTEVSRSIAALGPRAIAVEPPALIGSGIPVSKADPEVVSNSVEAVKKLDQGIQVLCGAGISTGSDVEAAMGLGAEGVLLASGVVKAADPRKVLLDLASGVP